MKDYVKVVGQIVAGVIVGNIVHDVVGKVVDVGKKVVNEKKEKSRN